MTLLELANRIYLTAQVGAAPDNPLLNTKAIIEILLPKVFYKVVSEAVSDENELNGLRSSHTLSISSGVVSCPVTIKEEYSESIVFTSAPTTSYQPTEFDYAQGDSLFDTFYVGAGQIKFREAGASAVAFTGTKNITAVTLPTLPTLSSDTVNIKEHLLQRIVTLGASVIKGEVPLASL